MKMDDSKIWLNGVPNQLIDIGFENVNIKAITIGFKNMNLEFN